MAAGKLGGGGWNVVHTNIVQGTVFVRTKKEPAGAVGFRCWFRMMMARIVWARVPCVLQCQLRKLFPSRNFEVGRVGKKQMDFFSVSLLCLFYQ